MREAVGDIDSGKEASHRLLHIVVNKATFRLEHLVFASQWVADLFAKKAVRKELQVGQQYPRAVLVFCLLLDLEP